MEKVCEPYQYVGSTLINDGIKDRVDLYIKEGFYYPIRENEKCLIKTQVKYEEVIDAPFEKDTHVGESIVFFDGNIVNKQNIYTIEGVRQKSIADKAKDIFDQWYLDWVKRTKNKLASEGGFIFLLNYLTKLELKIIWQFYRKNVK